MSRRMGMIAIDLPGSKRTFGAISKRIDATQVRLMPSNELNLADLDRIADELEKHFTHEALRRPRWQDSNLHAALMVAGAPFTAEGLGRYSIRGRRGENLLAMCAGLPNASLFIEVEDLRDQIGSGRGARIFGPISAARSNRYREIGWLASKSQIETHDEGRLMRSINRLK